MSVFPSKHRAMRKTAEGVDTRTAGSALPLEEMRRSDLVALAAARGLSPRRTARRGELIAALKEKQCP